MEPTNIDEDSDDRANMEICESFLRELILLTAVQLLLAQLDLPLLAAATNNPNLRFRSSK
jgi:hypothetical protein